MALALRLACASATRGVLRGACRSAPAIAPARLLTAAASHQGRGARALFPARASPPRLRESMATAAMQQTHGGGGASKDDEGELATKETATERALRQKAAADAKKFQMTSVDAKILQRMLDELGLDTPGKLRAFVTKRSLPVLGLSALEAVLNGVGSYCALLIFAVMPWDAAALLQRGWAPWAAATVAGFGQGAAALSAAVLGVNAIFSGATFFATLYASIAFDINARAFLETVHRLSGGVGIGTAHAGRRAAASFKAVAQLRKMQNMLEARSVQRASERPARSLAVHLSALAERGPYRGLGLAALALAPEEAATLARLFARHDADGDDKLTASELRAMMAELQPPGSKDVSEEAARAALSILDADGDGLVELDEFAAWYATSRLWRHGEEAAADVEAVPEEKEQPATPAGGAPRAKEE